jgi:hypothetical protein
MARRKPVVSSTSACGGLGAAPVCTANPAPISPQISDAAEWRGEGAVGAAEAGGRFRVRLRRAGGGAGVYCEPRANLAADLRCGVWGGEGATSADCVVRVRLRSAAGGTGRVECADGAA